MKYTVEGFSQEYALSLRKRVRDSANGKEKEIKIDCTDLVILRWFVDFYPNMNKMTVDGREYAWVFYKKLLADLPILDISTKACGDRMQKLAEFGILEFCLLKQGGTFSLYTFGENYINLVANSEEGVSGQTPTVSGQTPTVAGQTPTVSGQTPTVAGQTPTGCRSNGNPVAGQTVTKDNSIINTSIKDKEIKGGKKKEGLDLNPFIEEYTDNEALKDVLREFAEMRKSKRKPVSTPATIDRILKRLDKLSDGDVLKKIEIVEYSIRNCYTDIYPLRKEEEENGKGNGHSSPASGKNKGSLPRQTFDG